MKSENIMTNFLPMTKSEMNKLGWKQCDIIIVTGDAYVDHPSFGMAIIGRALEANGYKVGIISQPNWKSNNDFLELGKPKLFFGITSGNVDSMVNHYTVNKKKRSSDDYSPNGKAGLRPNRAVIVYTNKIKENFKDSVVVLGGVEASLRRISHYDYWNDKIRKSILLDSKADILVYGMGEKPIVEIAKRINSNENISTIDDIEGTVVKVKNTQKNWDKLPSHKEVLSNKNSHNEMVRIYDKNKNHKFAKIMYQKVGNQILKINIPSKPLTEAEMDEIYDLPFTRCPHPSYGNNKIPAYEQIFSSITSHRGCFGNCSFCAIAVHQGEVIQSRSQNSILNEVKKLVKHKKFKGTITDVGGPTANMYKMTCKIGGCNNMNCLFPKICNNLQIDSQDKYIKLLNKVSKLDGVKNIFVASGVRHDLLLKNDNVMKNIIKKFTGGHLKVAPEHLNDIVTKLMNKPSSKLYFKFMELFKKYSKEAKKKQYIVPYFISGHPGCTKKMMIDMKNNLKESDHKLQQAADFYPTPMTISTAMYYTGKHPLTGEKIYIPKSIKEKMTQFGIMMWHKKKRREYRKM
ncbi:MAG: YgiQ family radical SAM protein [Candidatus Marinimicrobia bacterium]|nr:YgiQ family radical SAM protein [Candidatus Neomarinimicrobiota bacterium]